MSDSGATDTVEMRLLERESSLGSLGEYAHEARRGAGRLVLVAGEAGVGKSALVEQLALELPASEGPRSTHWFWGACDGLFTPRPLGPLFDLASQLGGELLDLCRAGAAREELFDALLRAISVEGSAEEPDGLNVVVVEDVHWADEATVDLLRFLGRRLRDASVLLIATYRDDALLPRDPLRIALGELATQRSTRRIGLAPLSAQAVSILAGRSEQETIELHRLTGGNPFYVTEVIRAGIDTGVDHVPPSARDTVLARVARLSDEARDLLNVAALIGARVEPRLLESATACPSAAIDELLASGLLVEDGGWLKFRHEIARLAVAEAVPAHRGTAIHVRILAALGELGCEDDARLAFHAEAAADGPAVLRYAPGAARRAAQLAAHREAAAQYERALRFAAVADSGLDSAAVAGLYDGLAYEASLIDRWQDAADARENALELWRASGDRLREGDTMRRLSRTMWRLCRGGDALALAESAVTTLEPLGSTSELAWAYANLANQRMSISEHADAIELAQRAKAIAETLGMFDVLSDALNTESGSAASAGGDWAEPLREALEVALSHGLEEQAGRAYANLHAMLCEERRFTEADQYYAEGIAYCHEHDMGTFVTCLKGELTAVLASTGHWDESIALSAELLEQAASPINGINPLMSLGKIRARRGHPGAWECLDAALAAAEGTGEPGRIGIVRLARAEAYWLESDLGSFEREIGVAYEHYDSCDPWTQGAIAVGLNRMTSNRVPVEDPPEPYRLQIEGSWAQAAKLWNELDCPFDAAMALLDATEETPLREALAAFQALDAAAAIRITRQKMRALGIRSIPTGARTATRAHPLGLTRREHEVLDLICRGYTNAEIAGRLFISAKTVDHHVSAVLAKLGVPTRSVAASEAARLGLVGAEI